jgi:hypothetical protein
MKFRYLTAAQHVFQIMRSSWDKHTNVQVGIRDFRPWTDPRAKTKDAKVKPCPK